jgi:hypothetical protein
VCADAVAEDLKERLQQMIAKRNGKFYGQKGVNIVWQCDTNSITKPFVYRPGANDDDLRSSKNGALACAGFRHQPKPNPPLQSSGSSRTAAAPVSAPEPIDPTVLQVAISLTRLPLGLRCGAAASAVISAPGTACGSMLTIINGSGPKTDENQRRKCYHRSYNSSQAPRGQGQSGVFAAHLPGKTKVVLLMAKDSPGSRYHSGNGPQIIDLPKYWYTCVPSNTPIAPLQHLAPFEQKMHMCNVCLDMKSGEGFAPFCFRHFHITGDGTVRVFRQKFTLEDAIGSHACSLEENMRVTNGIPLGSSLLLPVCTVNCVQTLKVMT